MKAWWRNLSLQKKLHIPIQLGLLIVFPFVQLWVMGQFEAEMLEEARLQAQNRATQSFLSLNSMMLSGDIGHTQTRAVFLNKMAIQDGIKEFHLVRDQGVIRQYGEGIPVEKNADTLDQTALTTQQVQFQFIENEQHPSLRVVVPFTAQTEFFGVNCLQCHQVPEGTSLGAISLHLDLTDEYRHLEALSREFIVGQIALQLLLFGLISLVIKHVTRRVVKLEQTMQSVRESGDFSTRVPVRSEDEIGKISSVFNGFLGNIEELHQELDAKIASLKEYYERTQEELRIGSFIMGRMAELHSTDDAVVRASVRAADNYSGELVLLARTPSDKLHLLLADAVGHGLVAAMNLLPLCQVFNAMSKKGFPVSRIAEELNANIHRLMPADRFVCAVVVSVDFRNQVIEVWNGGIPEPLLLADNGEILHTWSSRHPPLGTLKSKEFASDVEVFHYDQRARLYLFSDGIPEATSPAGEQFGLRRITQVLQQNASEARFDELFHALNLHLQGYPAHDDTSLAEINIAPLGEQAEFVVNTLPTTFAATSQSYWQLSLNLGEDELRYLDAVPLLTQIVRQIRATENHHSALYVILSELFNNALDHGVLKMDSALKNGVDGFEQYLQQREQRLQELMEASIEIEIEQVMIKGKYGVKIRVTDSGDGFEYAVRDAASGDGPATTQHGRGLALARSMAYKMEHVGKGNEVVAYYLCA